MSLTHEVGPDYAVISEHQGDPANDSGEVVATFTICDDCEAAYPDPPYYTFDVNACRTSVGQDVFTMPHENCTGNLCPDCASMLEPDDENDPRKQELLLVWNPVLNRNELISKGVR
jgi:hypothetical protein